MAWFKWFLNVIFSFFQVLGSIKQKKKERRKRLKRKIKAWETKLNDEVNSVHEPDFEKNDPMGIDWWNRG